MSRAYSAVAAEVGGLPAAVRLLAGMIALAAPEAAAKAARVQELVKVEALTDSWLYESAALLTPLGTLSLPDAVVLLGDVPGCERLAAILRGADTSDEVVNTGIRLLAKATLREARIAQGLPMDEADDAAEPTEDLTLLKLRAGMICAEDLLSQSGSVIVPKNAVLQAVTLERIRRFAQGAGVREPVRVFAMTG